MLTSADIALPIEQYAVIGDCKSEALVGSNGSIDWLCWPRFDSPACFSALLGRSEHGRWLIAPADDITGIERSYIENTLVLETVFKTPGGSFALIDFMPVNQSHTSLVRVVEGRTGQVEVRMNMTLRFDYGSSVPWVSQRAEADGVVAIAGPNLVILRTSVALVGQNLSTVADFTIRAGERIPFVMSYGLSHRPTPEALDSNMALSSTLGFWRSWVAGCAYQGAERAALVRSLLTLKAMTFAETGAIVAAPTTSLPEQLGGPRNWDYRYCWIRDATLTLTAFMQSGFYEEAGAWGDWLRRAVAGTPDDLQIMYGIFGERRLAEWEVAWLPGYQGASPVRIGNAASGQLQLDVWGEIMNALHVARAGGLANSSSDWEMQCEALVHLESIWAEPDDGIWEVRGPRRQFTHSKVMAWVAFDRSIKDAQTYGLACPVEHWREIRDEIHRRVLDLGYDSDKQTFTQSFGSSELDASLLLIPEVDFLPISDPRVAGTVAAIERELMVDGLVLRYRTESGADGLPAGEGVFIPCSFWLVDVYRRQGREADANALLTRLLALRNDVGLLSEEYDTSEKRLIGNFPQAFSHLALVRSILGGLAQPVGSPSGRVT